MSEASTTQLLTEIERQDKNVHNKFWMHLFLPNSISSVQYPKISHPIEEYQLNPFSSSLPKKQCSFHTTVGKTKKERVKDEINLKPHVMDSTRNGYFSLLASSERIFINSMAPSHNSIGLKLLWFLPFSICLLQGMHRHTIKTFIEPGNSQRRNCSLMQVTPS